ncbi:MAG: RidA family protein [Defluviicoccus sp.]|nr:RidA family protein [Defluviicoccus sp.]
MPVEPLLPVTLGNGRVRYAPGMRAGSWVFATGHMAQDYGHGIAASVLREGAPNAAGPKSAREAARVFDNVEAVLAAGGSALDRVVRTDQYYTAVAMVPPYQAERRRRFGASIPPSTSIVQQGLLLPGAALDLQIVAVAGDGPPVEHIDHETLSGQPASGYSAALTAGDFVFVPGNTATAVAGEEARNGVAADALIAQGQLWGGERLRLETAFIVERRLFPSLDLAGLGPADVVKAQIYLTDPEDCAVVHDVWAEHFGAGAAVSVIPCAPRGLVIKDGRIEINILAHRDGGAVKEVVEAGVATIFAGQAEAVRCGDLLFLSALMAADGEGPLTAPDPRQPHFGDRAGDEADAILDAAARICEAAGTSLENVVRVQQFHTDIADFYPVHRAWQRRLPGRPIPFSAIEVPGPLPVPGCSVMMDLWVYAP